jgi:hypothetical protein
MQTHSGRIVDLSRLCEDDICEDDICHALAHIVRFTGHIKASYTVAQHSLMVSDLCPEQHRLWGLLHDASEAYLGDVSTPLKSLLPEYSEIEFRVQRMIACRFGLPWPIPKEVKAADREALMVEKRDLFDVQREWIGQVAPGSDQSVKVVMSPSLAKWVFQERLKQLSH